MSFSTELSIDYDPVAIHQFFREPETWFRLNPEWEVKNFEPLSHSDAHEFSLEVVYDRSEQRVHYCGSLESIDAGNGILLTLTNDHTRRIRVTFGGSSQRVQTIRLEEVCQSALEPRQQTELVFWLKSTCDYLGISNRSGRHWRIAHYLLDKVWLRLSPTGRRVVLLVIAFELLTLVFLLGFLAINRWVTN